MASLDITTISNSIEHLLEKSIPNHDIAEIYKYAVLPPGKAFRPQLVWSIVKDFAPEIFSQEFNNTNSKFHYFSSFVEVHHAYTLVHDDLPCMDDDDVRRGKPSTHKKFGEWRALLVGDGLLNVSYQLLSKINCEEFSNLFKFCSWSVGSKGLIQGQVLDLSEEMTLNFDNLVLTHQLKTARLMQVSLVGSFLTLNKNELSNGLDNRFKSSKMLFRLGHHIGVLFQLLDDLTELVDEEISQHESSVNPWLRFNEQCYHELTNGLEHVANVLEEYKLSTTKETMGLYFNKIRSILKPAKAIVEKHTSNDLMPVMSLLDRIC